MVVIDPNERFLNPIQRIDDMIQKLNQQRTDIISKDTHPERLNVLSKGGDYSDYEKQLLSLNPDISIDRRNIENINQLSGRLYDQKVSLEKDYNQFFGKALKSSQDAIEQIQQVTPELLYGENVEEARKKGQLLGEASKFGATASLREKGLSDIGSESTAARKNIMADQRKAIQAAQANQQKILFDLGVLGEQRAAEAAAAKKSSGGGGGGGFDLSERKMQLDANGIKYRIKLDKNGKEIERTYNDPTGGGGSDTKDGEKKDGEKGILSKALDIGADYILPGAAVLASVYGAIKLGGKGRNLGAKALSKFGPKITLTKTK